MIAKRHQLPTVIFDEPSENFFLLSEVALASSPPTPVHVLVFLGAFVEVCYWAVRGGDKIHVAARRVMFF